MGVVAVTREGTTNAMAAEWTTPISIEPRLIGVYVGDTRYTWELIRDATVFGLSLLTERQGGVSHVLGSYSGREDPKRSRLPQWLQPGTVLPVPLVRDASAHFECRLVDRHRYGDHILVVGSPVAARVIEEDRPLLYHGGRYHRLGPQLPKPES